MKVFKVYLLGLLVSFSACTDDSDNILQSYSTYSYSGYSDSSENSLVIDSKNFDESQTTWNGDIMNFRGSSEDMSIALQFNTTKRFISNFSLETFFTDGVVYYDNVSVKNYTGDKGVAHEIDLIFDQFFALHTTTNTTTSTITLPNSLKLLIRE